MQRILKELYYIGQLELPSAVFCGCVDVEAMMEGKQFHGYNERDLSVRQARDLKQKIKNKYEGVGQESIFLMLKESMDLLVPKMVPDFEPVGGPVWSLSEKRRLLNEFALKQFESHLDVEQVMIPCCGKNHLLHLVPDMFTIYQGQNIWVCKFTKVVQNSFVPLISGQHRSFAFAELMAEDPHSFNTIGYCLF